MLDTKVKVFHEMTLKLYFMKCLERKISQCILRIPLSDCFCSFDFAIGQTLDVQGLHILTYIVMHYLRENLSYLITKSLDMLPLHTLMSI